MLMTKTTITVTGAVVYLMIQYINLTVFIKINSWLFLSLECNEQNTTEYKDIFTAYLT